MTLNSVLWLLMAFMTVVGVIGVVNAFREKMRELEHRPASRLGRYRPNPDRAARRSKPA